MSSITLQRKLLRHLIISLFVLMSLPLLAQETSQGKKQAVKVEKKSEEKLTEDPNNKEEVKKERGFWGKFADYWSNFNDPNMPKKNSLSFLGGAYSLDSDTGDSSGFGTLFLEYSFKFNRKLALAAAYNNILKSGELGSVVWGFDFGLDYCVANCIAETEKIGNVTLTQYSKWGTRFGLGLSQRLFQLTTTSLDYTGPYLRGDALYFMAPNVKMVGRLQGHFLVNGNREMTIYFVLLGVSVDV